MEWDQSDHRDATNRGDETFFSILEKLLNMNKFLLQFEYSAFNWGMERGFLLPI